MNEYSDEISETKRIGRGSAILLVGRIINLILSFAVILMITRMLGPEKFGLYSFVISIAAMLATLTTLVNQGMTRFSIHYLASNQNGSAKDIFLKSSKLLVIISVISLICIIFISSFLSSFKFIILILPFVYLGFFSYLIMMIFYSIRKLHFFVLEGIIKNIFLVVFIPLLIANYGLEGSFLAYDVSAFITLLILSLCIYKIFWKKVRRVNAKETIYNIFSFSLPNFLSTVINNLSQRSGIFILTYFSYIYGMKEVGYFNLALTIILSIGTFLYSIPEAILPTVLRFKFQEKNSMIQEVVDTSLKYSLILAIPIVFSLVFISEPAVNLFFKADFGKAGLNIAILGFYLINLLIIKIFVSVIIANDDIRYLFYADAVSFIIFIISSVILIPSLASRGIALSLLFGSIGSASIYIWRGSHFGVKFPVKSVLKVIIPGLLFLLIGIFPPDLIILIPLTVVIAIVYYYVLYLLKEFQFQYIKRIFTLVK